MRRCKRPCSCSRDWKEKLSSFFLFRGKTTADVGETESKCSCAAMQENYGMTRRELVDAKRGDAARMIQPRRFEIVLR